MTDFSYDKPSNPDLLAEQVSALTWAASREFESCSWVQLPEGPRTLIRFRGQPTAAQETQLTELVVSHNATGRTTEQQSREQATITASQEFLRIKELEVKAKAGTIASPEIAELLGLLAHWVSS